MTEDYELHKLKVFLMPVYRDIARYRAYSATPKKETEAFRALENRIFDTLPDAISTYFSFTLRNISDETLASMRTSEEALIKAAGGSTEFRQKRLFLEDAVRHHLSYSPEFRMAGIKMLKEVEKLPPFDAHDITLEKAMEFFNPILEKAITLVDRDVKAYGIDEVHPEATNVRTREEGAESRRKRIQGISAVTAVSALLGVGLVALIRAEKPNSLPAKKPLTAMTPDHPDYPPMKRLNARDAKEAQERSR
jgi:hypothetical protein